MKTLIGVDLGGSFRVALNLCERLDFPRQNFRFLNIVEPMPSTGWFAPTGYVPPVWDSELKTAGEAAVESAIAQSCAQGIPADGHVAHGAAADALMAEADACQCDLISVGSSHKSRLASVLVGSVGRGLTIAAKEPVLLARNVRAGGPLVVVFATDHSPYAAKCLDKFLKWAPSGVSTVHLVTAVHIEEWLEEPLKKSLPQIGDDVKAWVHSEVSAKSEAAATRLRASGYETHSHVLSGHPNDVLHHAMHAFGGDILILGGQGHGFVERLIVGSVALHQAVAEDYSVLILRP
jgi:nucleotide-binding universal stress UspA family protein